MTASHDPYKAKHSTLG